MENFDLKKFLVENKLTYNSKLLKEVDTSNWGNEEDDYGRSEKDYRPKPSLADFDYDEEAYKKYMEDNFPGEPLEESWKKWVLGGLLTLSTLGGGAKLYQMDKQAQADKAKQIEYFQKVINPVLGKMSDEQLLDLGDQLNQRTGKYSIAPGSSVTPQEFAETLRDYAKSYIEANPQMFGITSDGQVQLLKK